MKVWCSKSCVVASALWLGACGESPAAAPGAEVSQGGSTAGTAGTAGTAASQPQGGVPSNGGAGAAGSQGGSVSASGGADANTGGASPLSSIGKCTLPSAAKLSDLEAAYAKWKADLVTPDGAGGFLRVRRPNSGTINSSNSEGTAYGMELAAYMNDQTLFDALWQYEQLHRGQNGLMEWEIGPDGTTTGSGAASDGDEDMALALVMADKKWGGAGSLKDTYKSYATQLIDLIWQHEVDPDRGYVLAPGDQFGGGAVINISYFAPAYYRVFGKFTGKTADWDRVVSSSYKVLTATLNDANKNASNGLVPAWSTPEGVPMAPTGSDHPTYHQLDSCRTPFRVAQDYCWFEEPRALDYLAKIGSFYTTIQAPNIVDGYNLDGSVYPGSSLHLAAFIGGAGVGAMAVPSLTALRDDSYGLLAAWAPLIGGSQYYNESWSVLSLLMMTGRFIEPTSL
ncbi:MAG: glycosyl hydrolase family 8 [Polyangiaceae bacterium]